MKRINTTAAWLLCAAFSMPAFSDDPASVEADSEVVEESAAPEAGAPDADVAGDAAGPPEMNFQYRTGDIILPNKVATMHLGGRYRYLDAGETGRLLEAWGNERDTSTQGAIVPGDVDPMTAEGWAVILTYKDDGHVDDSDAKEIDYADLLKDMKKGTEESNKARKDAGYEAVHLVGWAEPPHYDEAAKKLYWARELDFVGADLHTLNYEVRVLGREGVLSMNAVSTMNQLNQIKSDMRPLIQVAEFNPGYRYAEFNEDTDRVAEYGLGALIAGGVAAKLGLFGKLFAFLAVFKKFIVIGVLALGGLIAKLFGRKKEEST
jgi:uncharacterized membrane-anchored protein